MYWYTCMSGFWWLYCQTSTVYTAEVCIVPRPTEWPHSQCHATPRCCTGPKYRSIRELVLSKMRLGDASVRHSWTLYPPHSRPPPPPFHGLVRSPVNWATTFGQLGDKLLNYFFALIYCCKLFINYTQIGNWATDRCANARKIGIFRYKYMRKTSTTKLAVL